MQALSSASEPDPEAVLRPTRLDTLDLKEAKKLLDELVA